MSLSWWQKVVRSARTMARSQKRDERARLREKFWRWLQLEQLEDRTLLSTFQWTGASSANWSDAGNWTGGPAGTFPTLADDVAQFHQTTDYTVPQAVTVDVPITVGE